MATTQDNLSTDDAIEAGPAGRTARINGVDLYYEDRGKGDPAVVFVHGMAGGAWVWADQVQRLSSRFRCVTYDRRGHSRSREDGGDQSVAAHAEDLAALIRELDLDRPVVVASSGGAVVAVEFAHRHPEMPVGAVVSEPPLFSLDDSLAEKLMAEVAVPLRKAAKLDDPSDIVEAFFGVVCPRLWDRLDDDRRRNYRDNAPLVRKTLDALGATVTRDDVAGLRVPFCVVSGARSVDGHRALAKLLADARFVEFPDAGHGTYVEAPAQFADVVTGFAHEVGDRVPSAETAMRS